MPDENIVPIAGNILTPTNEGLQDAQGNQLQTPSTPSYIDLALL